MKKFVLFVLTLTLLLAAVTPVAAAPAQTTKAQIFSLVGRITAIGDNTVTVKVVTGNILIKPFIRQEFTVTVTAATRYMYKNGTLVVPITFGDLKVGDPVSIRGVKKVDGWYATRITKGATLKSLLP